jgi:SAM-dependent methyltransferase
MRFFARKLYYLPSDLFRSKDQLVPPRGLIYTGSGDFLKAGKDWTAFFSLHGLKKDQAFLDIGSGIGRMAVGLTSLLKGQYEGFEAMNVGVEWCEKNITPVYPNFHFQHINLHNDLYNKDGLDAATFVFPYNDKTFNFACAISVFSHMIDTEADNYLRECIRVLKPGGIFVATFFVLHKGMAQKHKSFSFNHDRGHYALMNDKVVSANVAFDYDWLMARIKAHGFQVVDYLQGSWSGYEQKERLAFQDVFVLRVM